MYPAHFFSLFPPFPREEKVFVAMSFDSSFDARWQDVIAPAVRLIAVNETRLEPVRVDTRSISDSVLTEIMSGVANSRLIFADITTIGFIDEKPIRNGNVMYEVGLAQAVRLPEEVVLFRSDKDPLLFDTSNIRVNSYSPDTAPNEAKDTVSNALFEAHKELELRRHLAVQKAVKMLDSPSMFLLFESLDPNGVSHPRTDTMGQILANVSRGAAISKLLELGAIQAVYPQITPETLDQDGSSTAFDFVKYECTEFGRSVGQEVANRLGFSSPDLQEKLEAMIVAGDEVV